MEDTLKSLPPSVQMLIILVLGWLAKNWWEDKSRRAIDSESALTKNTLALVELQVQIKNLTEVISILPRLRADLDVAHSKIRQLEQNDGK